MDRRTASGVTGQRLRQLRRSLYIVIALLLVGILTAYALSRLASKPLHQLTREAIKIERFDFEAPLHVESQITEVVDLAHAMGSMKDTIKRFLQLSTALPAKPTSTVF